MSDDKHDPKDGCPKCGFDAYTYQDLCYVSTVGIFGYWEEEFGSINPIKPPTKTVTCLRCEARYPKAWARGGEDAD